MRSDPERIQELLEERARRERASGKRTKAFGEVLEQEDEDEASVRADDEAEDELEDEPAEVAPARPPPDPRQAALHARFEDSSRSKKARGKKGRNK